MWEREIRIYGTPGIPNNFSSRYYLEEYSLTLKFKGYIVTESQNY